MIPLPVMRMSQSVEGRGGLSVKAIVGVWERGLGESLGVRFESEV